MTRLGFAIAMCGLAAALAAPGCTDVGDSSAVPGIGGVNEDGSTASDDDAASFEDGSLEGGGATTALADSGEIDSAAPEDDDAGGGEDTGVIEAASSEDSGESDAEAPDATIADSGPADTGSSDDVGSGAVEAGPDGEAGSGMDAGQDSGSTTDAGQDSSSGSDSGGALAACTTATQTSCVQCQGSAGGVCTPTEALLVQYDITKGYATAAGADSANGCYTCLLDKQGLDDILHAGDTGAECGDVAAEGTFTAQGAAAACLTTLSCILTTSCATAALYLGDAGKNDAVSDCYCGTSPTSGACTTGGANGPCDGQEAAGLGFAESNGLAILENFTTETLPSGQANFLIQYALSNGCSMCLQ
jgi:hypothetical protein